MPRLSDSMEEGTIVRWLKGSGELVASGEPIVEIETDKATLDYEAEAAGVLDIVVPDGTTIALGDVIARILTPGDASSTRPERMLATPVARRIAAELGIDLAGVRGSGARGQIVKADVETAANGQAPAIRREELTRAQRVIASRMTESRAVIPDFALEVEIDMEACLALRAQLTEHADPPPSINDMVVKACALTLAQHPRVNGAYRDGGFELYEQVHIGVAVAAQDPLIVPVVRDADRKRLVEIARTTRELAARVRSGEITPQELAGATFTVSNLGMYGIDRFTAVINPPQAAILAVGAVGPRAVVRDGRLAIATTMAATLVSDHRILYGADAAAFLRDVRERLQAPINLLV